MAKQKAQTVDELEAELARVKDYARLLEERNKAQTEGKDQTGTYGWTNLPQDEADRIRIERQGGRYITKAERDESDRKWSQSGMDQKPSPVSNTRQFDGETGQQVSGPDGAPKVQAKPFKPVETVDAPPDEKTIL